MQLGVPYFGENNDYYYVDLSFIIFFSNYFFVK